MDNNVTEFNKTRANLILGSYSNAPVIAKSLSAEEKLINSTLEEMIEKGEIADTLGRGYGAGNKPLEFKKTGAQLKEKLPAVITSLQGEQIKIQAKLDVLLEQIGIEPTEERNSSYVKALVYKSYPWTMCEPKYMNGNYEERTDQMTQCAQYNSLGYTYCSLAEDILSCQAILNNVDDKTTYTLSASQLVALGL